MRQLEALAALHNLLVGRVIGYNWRQVNVLVGHVSLEARAGVHRGASPSFSYEANLAKSPTASRAMGDNPTARTGLHLVAAANLGENAFAAAGLSRAGNSRRKRRLVVAKSRDIERSGLDGKDDAMKVVSSVRT